MDVIAMTTVGAAAAWGLMRGVRAVRGPEAFVAIYLAGLAVVVVLVAPGLFVIADSPWAAGTGLALVLAVVIFEGVKASLRRIALSREGQHPDRWAELKASHPLRSDRKDNP